MKILIRLPNWLGDVVMSTAFIAAVRQHYPLAQIDIIIKKELEFLASLIPGINQVHPFSKQSNKGLSGAYRFGKSLRAEKYDLFFTLPDSISSLTIGWATNAKQRVGFSKEGGFLLLTKTCKRPTGVHRVEEYLSMLQQFTGAITSQQQVFLKAEESISLNSEILINFNSEADSRRMPVDKARSLINLITYTFKEANFGFIGAPKDVDYVDSILENAQNKERIKNYTGKTSLPDLANIMAGAKFLLTTDSGPAHLANALNLPVIALFGAGNENNTAPYNQNNLTVIRYGQLICEPCVRNECKLYGIPKCMELLDDSRIINAMNVYLQHA